MKKLISGLTALTIAACLPLGIPAYAEDSFTLAGDADNNGSFDSADVSALQKWLVKAAPSINLKNADMDLNGKVNVYDLFLMKKALKNKPQTPPENDFSALYEAENAKLGGANKVMPDNGASGGKAVGSFANDSDNIAFTIEVPSAGCYQLVFRSKGIGGDKENNILIDGTPNGTFKSTASSYSDYTIRGVMLSAGEHTVTVTKSWGWMLLDSLQIKQDEAVKNSVYDVSNQLIDKNADAKTQKLFDYLCESYGKVTLSGQVCDNGFNGDEFKAIYEVTGKYPAIIGLDMMDYAPARVALGARSNAYETAVDFHNAGGICTFCWHWNAPTKYLKSGTDSNGNPRWWGGFYTENSSFDIEAVMNGSDPEGMELLNQDIKEIAAQLKRLDAAGIPVLWRPLHEASGGWFWWGAKGAEPYKKLWKYLYSQLTEVYGCHNLIWVWNGQAADWYPGDEFVDIIGEDIYAGERVYSAQNAKFTELLGYSDTNKIIALTENGTLFDIDNVIAANTRWAWFDIWSGEFITANGKFSDRYTEADILKKAYNSEYVITLDELPEF